MIILHVILYFPLSTAPFGIASHRVLISQFLMNYSPQLVSDNSMFIPPSQHSFFESRTYHSLIFGLNLKRQILTFLHPPIVFYSIATNHQLFNLFY